MGNASSADSPCTAAPLLYGTSYALKLTIGPSQGFLKLIKISADAGTVCQYSIQLMEVPDTDNLVSFSAPGKTAGTPIQNNDAVSIQLVGSSYYLAQNTTISDIPGVWSNQDPGYNTPYQPNISTQSGSAPLQGDVFSFLLDGKPLGIIIPCFLLLATTLASDASSQMTTPAYLQCFNVQGAIDYVCPAGYFCDIRSNTCVKTSGCTTDKDCTDPTLPYCVSGTCKAALPTCTKDIDCTDPSYPYCFAGACVQTIPACQIDADCKDSSYPFCVAEKCAAQLPSCSADKDCTDPSYPICDTVGHTCMAIPSCSVDADCKSYPNYPYCVSGHCQAALPSCNGDKDCTDPGYPHCDIPTHTCKPASAPCTKDADCTNPNFPYCIHGACQATIPACVNDADCVDPNFPYCVSGQCKANKPPSPPPSPSKSPILIIVIVVLVVFGLGVGGFLMWKKRKSAFKGK